MEWNERKGRQEVRVQITAAAATKSESDYKAVRERVRQPAQHLPAVVRAPFRVSPVLSGYIVSLHSSWREAGECCSEQNALSLSLSLSLFHSPVFLQNRLHLSAIFSNYISIMHMTAAQ